jgi:single-stranded-DNA-specific exonuclease
MQQLNLFSPFGAENENPVFLTRNVTDTGGSRLVGMNNRHTKLEVTDRTVSIPFSGIAFSTDGYYDELKSRIPLDICYTLEENNRSIKRNVQLIVKDMRLS